MAVDDADDMGANVAAMIAKLLSHDMPAADQFRNLMVWYACERLRGSDDEEDEAAN